MAVFQGFGGCITWRSRSDKPTQFALRLTVNAVQGHVLNAR
jgi:hypothetical protein